MEAYRRLYYHKSSRSPDFSSSRRSSVLWLVSVGWCREQRTEKVTLGLFAQVGDHVGVPGVQTCELIARDDCACARMPRISCVGDPCSWRGPVSSCGHQGARASWTRWRRRCCWHRDMTATASWSYCRHWLHSHLLVGISECHRNRNMAETILVNSSPLSAAYMHQWTGSTLVQVMARCLTAPSHYLNRCWLIVSKVLWHLSEGVMLRISADTISKSRSKIASLKSYLDLPGDIELTWDLVKYISISVRHGF